MAFNVEKCIFFQKHSLKGKNLLLVNSLPLVLFGETIANPPLSVTYYLNGPL